MRALAGTSTARQYFDTGGAAVRATEVNKAALALRVKDWVTNEVIEAREQAMLQRAMARWSAAPGIDVLGNPDPTRRIAIVSTFAFLAHGETKDTLRIARKLLSDKEPLIHKAVGWLLREAGKVSRPELVRFLEKYGAKMPRTTLRYAVERFSPEERKQWLSRTFTQSAGKPGVSKPSRQAFR